MNKQSQLKEAKSDRRRQATAERAVVEGWAGDFGVLQRAVEQPGLASAQSILALQSAYGNRAVNDLLSGASRSVAQAKLRPGTTTGTRPLARELSQVVQQTGGGALRIQRKEITVPHSWNQKQYNTKVTGDEIPSKNVYVAKRAFNYWHSTIGAQVGYVFVPTPNESVEDQNHYWNMNWGRVPGWFKVHRIPKKDVILASDKLAKEWTGPFTPAVVVRKTALRPPPYGSRRDTDVGVSKVKWAPLAPGDTLLVDFDAAGVSEGGDTGWFPAKERKEWPAAYVRSSAVAQSTTPKPKTEPGEGEGGIFEDVKTIEGLVEKGVSSADDRLLDALRKRVGEQEKTEARGEVVSGAYEEGTSKLSVVEGVVWTAAGGLNITGGIMGMASAMKGFVDDQSSAYERVQAAFDLISSVSDVAAGAYAVIGGVTQLVAEAATEGSTVADNAAATSAFSLSYQEMFSTLSSGIKTMKDVVDLVHVAMEKKSGKAHGGEEWAAATTKTLTDALQTGKGVVKSIRFMHEALGGGVTSALSQTIGKIIPGIDIAIDAINSIMRGYYLIKSARQWWQMYKREKELQGELKEKGYAPEEVKEARGFYAKHEAMIATLDGLIAKNEGRIEAKKNKILDLPIKGTDKELKARLKKARTLDDEIDALAHKNETYKARKAELEKEVTKYEAGHYEFTIVSLGEPGQEAESYSAAVNPTRMELAEVDLAAELGATNRKRVVRQAFHLVTNMVKIAGSIATLIAGPGAPAAIGLKAAATGIDLSLPLFRWIKQKGRDVAAKSVAKGKTGIASKVFNADKATRAKLQMRKKQAVVILMMVAGLNDLIPETGKPAAKERFRLEKQAARVEGYIRATGCAPKKLYQANGKPQEQIKILVKELAKREFE